MQVIHPLFFYLQSRSLVSGLWVCILTLSLALHLAFSSFIMMCLRVVSFLFMLLMVISLWQSFMNLCVDTILQICKTHGHYIFKYYFCVILLVLLGFIVYVFYLSLCPISLLHFYLYFPLLFSLCFSWIFSINNSSSP